MDLLFEVPQTPGPLDGLGALQATGGKNAAFVDILAATRRAQK